MCENRTETERIEEGTPIVYTARVGVSGVIVTPGTGGTYVRPGWLSGWHLTKIVDLAVPGWPVTWAMVRRTEFEVRS
jgi:hypothetical protein